MENFGNANIPSLMFGFIGWSAKVNLYQYIYYKRCNCAIEKRNSFKYVYFAPHLKKPRNIVVSKRIWKRCHLTLSSTVEKDFMIFRSRELLEESVESESLLKEFLQSCPQRILCNSISRQHTQVLKGQVIQAKLPSIRFFHFQIVPVINLKYETASDTLTVRSISWELFGLEAFGSLHDKFDLTLVGEFRATRKDTKPVLRGKADLIIKLRYSSPLQAIPRNVVQSVGQNVTDTILRNVKKRLTTNVLAEYSQWLAERTNSSSMDSSKVL